MKKIENMTKAELIEHLSQVQADKDALEKEKEVRDKAIDLDMNFSATPEEKTEKQKKQAQKDFIKKMTHGMWTSQEKYQEFIDAQQKAMRMF